MIIQNLSRNDDWKDSFSFYDAQTIGRGSSGSVLAINQDLVIKIFSEDEEGQLDLDRERDIFHDLQRDGGSPYIVKFLEIWEDGLILERLKCNLRSRLREKSQLALQARFRWLIEACKAIEFLHNRGVMHGDIGCHNFLVDRRSHIKLCDFAGSTREGETARICYEIRGQHPEYQIGQPITKTEIFALGSTMFEIYTSRSPYAEQIDAVVQKKFQERVFPLAKIECLVIRRIIQKCWMDEYVEVSDVRLDLLAAWRAQLL
ncbi:kinase-like protein [Stipitochalara longipes BDJ]|nr:kinase-like protein [Stipitochalara longipes BDJ]